MRAAVPAFMRKLRALAYSLTGATIVAGSVLAGAEQRAHAGQAGGAVFLPVVAEATAASLLGDDNVVLLGGLQVELGPPLVQDGLQVSDVRVVAVELRGASRLGIVIVEAQPLDGPHGELRSLQPGAKFPATASLDLFLEVALPSTPFGPFALRNDEPLTLQGSVSEWPPLGATLAREASGDEDCVPLLDAVPDPKTELDLCVHEFSLIVAPQLPGYSAGRDGPSSLHPADVLGIAPSGGLPADEQAPFVRLACEDLGLSADGCDDADADLDNISGLSYGMDFESDAAAAVEFSVAPGASGVLGSAVAVQGACPPGDPGASPEPEADVFRSAFDGANELVLDGNGPVGACEQAFPLSLVEALGARDDLDALAGDPSAVDADGDGVPEQPVYFTLDRASPSLAAFGIEAGDVLMSVGGRAGVYASASALGLGPQDAIDGLCLREDGDGTYGGGDKLRFSLAPGSPALAAADAGPGDLLAPGDPPLVARTSAALGLAVNDDVDALACPAELGDAGARGDVDCSGAVDGVDALLVLQWHAGLLAQLPCPGAGDVDGSGMIDSRDAALVLQIEAGLTP